MTTAGDHAMIVQTDMQKSTMLSNTSSTTWSTTNSCVFVPSDESTYFSAISPLRSKHQLWSGSGSLSLGVKAKRKVTKTTSVFGIIKPKARAGWPKRVRLRLVRATPCAEINVMSTQLCSRQGYLFTCDTLLIRRLSPPDIRQLQKRPTIRIWASDKYICKTVSSC